MPAPGMKVYARNLTNQLHYDTVYRSDVPFTQAAPGHAFYLITTAKF